MYISRRTLFVLNIILVGLSIYIVTRIEPINRRLEALPYYARTYMNQMRPQPELPPPPATSAIDPQSLLSEREAGPASEAYLQQVLESTPAVSSGGGEVRLADSRVIEPAPIAPQVQLSGFTHEWQSWNNCGPVTIAMNLSYYGRSETQVEAAQFLKPNEDDKNVNPAELAAYARSLGLEVFVGAGGDIPLLQQLLSNHLPVIVESWAEPEDRGGMGHYRLLTGYDREAAYFITQDSLHGPDVTISFAEFDSFWQVFNRKYILIYPPEQASLVHAILGSQAIKPQMRRDALETALAEARNKPNNAFAWFNIGTNYARLDEPVRAAAAFDEARRLGLPARMLWYQFEIFEVYLETGRNQEVIDLTTAILEATGGLEELYYYRGLARPKPEAAVDDFRAALAYNPHFSPAAEALDQSQQ